MGFDNADRPALQWISQRIRPQAQVGLVIWWNDRFDDGFSTVRRRKPH